MKTGLLKDGLKKIISGIILTGLLLFLPAGDIHWQNGWLFMALLFVPMFFAGIVIGTCEYLLIDTKTWEYEGIK